MGYFTFFKKKVTETTQLLGENSNDDSCMGKMKDIFVKIMAFVSSTTFELILPIIMGLTMCFFGGHFYTIIACCEAYIMCGYESSLLALEGLKTMFVKVWETNEEYNKSHHEGGLMTHTGSRESMMAYVGSKLNMLADSIDKNQLSKYLASLNQGFMAVVATMKNEFCMAVTLGNSIAVMLDKPISKVVIPVLKSLIPGKAFDDHAEDIVHGCFKAIGITIAFWLQTYISAFQAAMRGGLMASRGAMAYLIKLGYFPDMKHEDTYIDEIVGYTFAGLGFYYQLMSGFHIPFPLNLITWPVDLAQHFIIVALGVK